MKNLRKPISTEPTLPVGQRSYNEIVEFLDNNWSTNLTDNELTCIKKLDQEFNNISQKINTVLVAGTNGKSLTLDFTAKLLKTEGVKFGTFYSPHLMTYNERLTLNNESISNKEFTEIANEVINKTETLGLAPNTYELLTIMALIYFKNNNVDVALLEVSEDGLYHATNICSPKIVAITRIVPEKPNELQKTISEMLEIVKSGTWVISADQSKLNLQMMADIVQKNGGKWVMPIRKLASLPYPFEQLHGRCAALAERISHIFVNKIATSDATVVAGSILTKPKAQRGRPTLEAKRQAELNPQKTVDQFWKEELSTLPARFQILDKEKPSILLDNANNLDAFQNLMLGIRLLHYQRPLKGLTVILGGNNHNIDLNELLKVLRYFFKKTSGQIIVCPIDAQPGHKGSKSWNVEKITNDIKSMKIKARTAKNFNEAFEVAQTTVDERHGLVVITGSSSIITEYWRYKGIKRI